MTTELNEHGFLADFQSRFSPKANVAQGVRFREYLEYEAQQGPPEFADLAKRLAAFSAYCCPACIRELPPQKKTLFKKVREICSYSFMDSVRNHPAFKKRILCLTCFE
jgi:hypothetical protein